MGLKLSDNRLGRLTYAFVLLYLLFFTAGFVITAWLLIAIMANALLEMGVSYPPLWPWLPLAVLGMIVAKACAAWSGKSDCR